MKRLLCWSIAGVALLTMIPALAQAEILAMVNYETKPGQTFRKEGIAIIDVDPNSPNFGKNLGDMPLPHDLHNHHIFYNRDMSKAYITALGQGFMYVMDMKKLDYSLKKIAVGDCKVGEDVIFSGDNSTWYLTCMGSGNIIVGDADTDRIKSIINLPFDNPHGIAINDEIDRKPGDERFAFAAAGGSVRSFEWKLAVEGLSGRAPRRRLVSGQELILELDRRELLQLLLSIGRRVGPGAFEIGGRFPVAGRNLPAGPAVFVGYFMRWGRR